MMIRRGNKKIETSKKSDREEFQIYKKIRYQFIKTIDSIDPQKNKESLKKQKLISW